MNRSVVIQKLETKAKRKIVIDDTEPKKPKFKKVKEEEEIEDGETY